MDSQPLSPDQAAKAGVPPLDPPLLKKRSLVETWSYLIFLAGLILTTAGPILVRLSEVGPVATAAWRMSLAVPVLALFLYFEPRETRTAGRLQRKDYGLLVLSGLFLAADIAMWNSSVMLTSVASASFLANGAPVFVVLLSWLLFKERPTSLFLLGLLVGVGGSALMMSESLRMSSRNFVGDFLSLAAAGFYACYILTVARARQRASTLTLMTLGSAVSAAVLWMAAPLMESGLVPSTTSGWLVVLAIALLTQVAGQTLIALSLGYVPANFSALILLLQPVIPSLAAWVLFNETLSAMQAIGAVGIVIGLALARPRSRDNVSS
ncbi:MAG: DMT family transporter [Rhodospirillaceae bacterium]